MTVLGRLVDFAGLWERDLYFATAEIALPMSAIRLGRLRISPPNGRQSIRSSGMSTTLLCDRGAHCPNSAATMPTKCSP
jgi:hypothetical protein